MLTQFGTFLSDLILTDFGFLLFYMAKSKFPESILVNRDFECKLHLLEKMSSTNTDLTSQKIVQLLNYCTAHIYEWDRRSNESYLLYQEFPLIESCSYI